MAILNKATFFLWIALCFAVVLQQVYPTYSKEQLAPIAQFVAPFMAVPFVVVFCYKVLLVSGPQGTSAAIPYEKVLAGEKGF